MCNCMGFPLPDYFSVFVLVWLPIFSVVTWLLFCTYSNMTINIFLWYFIELVPVPVLVFACMYAFIFLSTFVTFNSRSCWQFYVLCVLA